MSVRSILRDVTLPCNWTFFEEGFVYLCKPGLLEKCIIKCVCRWWKSISVFPKNARRCFPTWPTEILPFFGEEVLRLWPLVENERRRWAMAHTTSPKWPRYYYGHEEVVLAKRRTKAWSPRKRVLPLPSRMRAGYASSLSAFSGGHAQCSSTAPVTTTSPAPHTGITNAHLARATSPVVMQRGLEMSLRDWCTA